MIQKLVRGIVGYGVTSGGIKNEDKEVYIYGYTLLIETSMCIAFTGCIGMLFNLFFEVIVFSAVFIPLRSFGGGIHADKAWKCLLTSVIVIMGYCIILNSDCHDFFYWILLLFNMIGILVCQSRLKPIQYGKYLSSKVIVNSISIISILMSGIFLCVKENLLAEGILIGVFVWMISFFANEYLKKSIR